MNFNPNPSKQAEEVIFSRMFQQRNHNLVYFNHSSDPQVLSQKHLGMYLDPKLNSQEHLSHVHKESPISVQSKNLLCRWKKIV